MPHLTARRPAAKLVMVQMRSALRISTHRWYTCGGASARVAGRFGDGPPGSLAGRPKLMCCNALRRSPQSLNGWVSYFPLRSISKWLQGNILRLLATDDEGGCLESRLESRQANYFALTSCGQSRSFSLSVSSPEDVAIFQHAVAALCTSKPARKLFLAHERRKSEPRSTVRQRFPAPRSLS
jgi:hypothetical protein